MSDTSETDAAYKNHPWDMHDYIPLEFCQKLERERDAAKDNVRKLAVSLADSIRFSLARQDETEEAMEECNELRILVDGLLEMNQKLSDERNSHYNELLTKRGLCRVQEQVITDWKLEAEKWRAIANDHRN